MANPKGGWINLIAAVAGGILIAIGILDLRYGFQFGATFLAVAGFLLVGWAALDYRRFRTGTQESEVSGGRTIE
jgi:hypothetical protein